MQFLAFKLQEYQKQIKKGNTKSGIDKLYKKISGPHYFKKVRDDINEKTFKQKKFFKILK